MNHLPACMGGWCQLRDSCARHHAPNRAEPAERLCSPKQPDLWQPISIDVAWRQPPAAAEAAC